MLRISLVVIAMSLFGSSAHAGAKMPVLFDCDIGTDVDDAFALALLLSSPELEVRGITTCGNQAEDRAWMVCRFLTAVGRREIPVAWGAAPQAEETINQQIQYRRHPAVIFNRTARPLKKPAVELLYEQLKADPGKITLLPVGPLTNIARLLTEHPDCKPWIKQIVLMGGSVRVGYNGKAPPQPEWNIVSDVKAAQIVFASGIPLVVAPLDATTLVRLEAPSRQKLFDRCTPTTYQLQALYSLWDQPTPVLYDPVAVALCVTDKFCTMENLHLSVDDKGLTRVGNLKPNARVATASNIDAFLDWYVDRVGAGQAVLPKAPSNLSKLIPADAFPNRVHAFEDFETDIEKRWWMSGKAEKMNLPPGSTRACQGVLTQDFDDRQGDMKTMYNAVIFNPVPGPPMGKNPRLSFRYWIKGTDTLRVQIYSLTNGYHRYLALTGLPQGRWQSGTVDMTQVRRPDGSGGPLSENERIDDIQFYVEPRAELYIDDIVLYDAPVAGEKRPFPKRILFTGLFDTGKQGKEWPGTFEIVPTKGYFWHAARSVLDPETKSPRLNINLRGPRPTGAKTHLSFRYQLSGADSAKIVVLSQTPPAAKGKEAVKHRHVLAMKNLQKDTWAETTTDLGQALASKGQAFPVRPGDAIEEIQFLLPPGAELLLDDVLLYEP